MAIVSSIFFVISLILAVLLGAQTLPWTWGPALIFLGIAVLAALPALWRSRYFNDPILLGFGVVVIGWFAWRASISPVKELAVADLLLLAGAVGSFIVMRAISANEAALRIFMWGLAVLLLGSVIVVGKQLADPGFTAVYAHRPVTLPSGFYGHYNDCANFLICVSLLLGGSALLGAHRKLTRMIWGSIAIAGMGAVYFTYSRSGILAMAVGGFVFAAATLVYGKREKAKWFWPLAVGLPVLTAIVGCLVVMAWMKAQQVRSYDVGMEGLMDNTIRLSLMGIAFSCIGTHPWAGGGCRSFSWECYQFWGVTDNGWNVARPEYVHNEILQTLTDYGIVGGLLLALLMLVIFLGALIRTWLPKAAGRLRQADALYVSAIAAVCGMLTQSSLNFVFHLLPGAFLLGICLGRASQPAEPAAEGNSPQWFPKILISGIAVLLMGLVFPYGVKATRTMAVLWRTELRPAGPVTESERLLSLAKAIEIWPQAYFYKQRGMILHAKVRDDIANHVKPANAEEALANYRAGLALHPYDVSLAVNFANLLSACGLDEEASSEFKRATYLQGGMELGFHAYFHSSKHLVKVGSQQLAAEEPENAMRTFAMAADEFEQGAKGNPSLRGIEEGVQLKYQIYDGLGLAREGSGYLDEALAAYDELAKISPGPGNYRYSVLLERMGLNSSQMRRPSEALAQFQRARERANLISSLPSNVSPEQRTQLITRLDAWIKFLIDTKN